MAPIYVKYLVVGSREGQKQNILRTSRLTAGKYKVTIAAKFDEYRPGFKKWDKGGGPDPTIRLKMPALANTFVCQFLNEFKPTCTKTVELRHARSHEAEVSSLMTKTSPSTTVTS